MQHLTLPRSRHAPQAARVLAQLLIAGGTVVFRAASQAYRQAIISELRCSAAAAPAAGLTGVACYLASIQRRHSLRAEIDKRKPCVC